MIASTWIFLLVEPETMQPLVVIELDDSCHNRSDRRKRDQFVDQVFARADLPLLHIRVKRSYQADELSTTLTPYLGNGKPRLAHDVSPQRHQSMLMTNRYVQDAARQWLSVSPNRERIRANNSMHVQNTPNAAA
jgi:hypothetical protein